jgi:hypothetical protein
MEPLYGRCQCGAVRYCLQAPIETAFNCHCSICRKLHGAAFASLGRVPLAAFRILSGDEYLSRYESSPGHQRLFCSTCGSRLGNLNAEEPHRLHLALGTLESSAPAPRAHVFVGSKADWWTITDALPQFASVPGAAR